MESIDLMHKFEFVEMFKFALNKHETFVENPYKKMQTVVLKTPKLEVQTQSEGEADFSNMLIKSKS